MGATPAHGGMAQLVARLHGMQKVRGSNPLTSTAGKGRDIGGCPGPSSMSARHSPAMQPGNVSRSRGSAPRTRSTRPRSPARRSRWPCPHPCRSASSPPPGGAPPHVRHRDAAGRGPGDSAPCRQEDAGLPVDHAERPVAALAAVHGIRGVAPPICARGCGSVSVLESLRPGPPGSGARSRGYGAVGSASAWHAEGQGFESPYLHGRSKARSTRTGPSSCRSTVRTWSPAPPGRGARASVRTLQRQGRVERRAGVDPALLDAPDRVREHAPPGMRTRVPEGIECGRARPACPPSPSLRPAHCATGSRPGRSPTRCTRPRRSRRRGRPRTAGHRKAEFHDLAQVVVTHCRVVDLPGSAVGPQVRAAHAPSGHAERRAHGPLVPRARTERRP